MAEILVDEAHIASLRKGVLAIARAAESVASISDIDRITTAIRAWRARWETFSYTLRQDLEERLRAADRPYDSQSNPNPPKKEDAEYYLKNSLLPMWEFDTELARNPVMDLSLKDSWGNPWRPPEEVFEATVQFHLSHGYASSREEAVRKAEEYHAKRPITTKAEAQVIAVTKWKEEAQKWAQRLRVKARRAWATLSEYIVWLESWRGGARPLKVIHPEEEVVPLAGLRVVFRGFEESPYKDRIDAVRAALEKFVSGAKARAPILLRVMPPIVIEWTSEPTTGGDAAGYYEAGKVFLTPWVIGDNIAGFVKTLAHEVGHHAYRTSLSEDSSTAWSQYIRGNYRNLDLREALDVMSRVGASYTDDKRLMAEDPILHLQLSTLIWSISMGNKELYTAKEIRRYLEEGNDPIVRVPVHPITGYAGKNSEEAFCEAVGMLVAYGPKAVPDPVLGMLRAVTGNEVRIASPVRVVRAWLCLREG